MRIKTGNAFIQYSIIIILIALAVVFVYTLLGQNIINNLSFLSSSMNKSAKSVSFKSSDGKVASYHPGDLKGTPNNPVSECNSNVCILDYGEYILNGIPANFEDESTSSRGTDKLADVMQSMLQQLEAENKPEDPDLTALIELLKQAITNTDVISDAEQVLEVAALDVYLNQGNQIANEQEVLQNILQNLQDNRQYQILNDAGLIVIPKPGEELSPETPLFRDDVWVNDSNYSKTIIEALSIESKTDNLESLKPKILEAASDCGKEQQGESIAYLIDIITQVSNEAQTAASNNEEILEVKSIVDNKDISLLNELINIAKSI